jgi:hypothetical protein
VTNQEIGHLVILTFWQLARRYSMLLDATTLLYTARRCSTLLDATQRYSMLLDATRRCSTLLNAARCCPMLLDAFRRYSTLLNATQRCSTLFDAVQRYFFISKIVAQYQTKKIHFLPASIRSIPQGLHFTMLLLWRPLIKLGNLSADSWSNMIRLDQRWSNLIRD